MSNHYKSTFGALILLFVAFTSSAQFSKVDEDVKQIMKEQDIVGMSFAVVKNGKILYANSFGQKNIENNTPLTNSDIFRIASISKSFSATSIMQLVEAGKISLDDDFGKLVGFKIRNPNFPETYF